MGGGEIHMGGKWKYFTCGFSQIYTLNFGGRISEERKGTERFLKEGIRSGMWECFWIYPLCHLLTTQFLPQNAQFTLSPMIFTQHCLHWALFPVVAPKWSLKGHCLCYHIPVMTVEHSRTNPIVLSWGSRYPSLLSIHKLLLAVHHQLTISSCHKAILFNIAGPNPKPCQPCQCSHAKKVCAASSSGGRGNLSANGR